MKGGRWTALALAAVCLSCVAWGAWGAYQATRPRIDPRCTSAEGPASATSWATLRDRRGLVAILTVLRFRGQPAPDDGVVLLGVDRVTEGGPDLAQLAVPAAGLDERAIVSAPVRVMLIAPPLEVNDELVVCSVEAL